GFKKRFTPSGSARSKCTTASKPPSVTCSVTNCKLDFLYFSVARVARRSSSTSAITDEAVSARIAEPNPSPAPRSSTNLPFSNSAAYRYLWRCWYTSEASLMAGRNSSPVHSKTHMGADDNRFRCEICLESYLIEPDYHTIRQ